MKKITLLLIGLSMAATALTAQDYFTFRQIATGAYLDAGNESKAYMLDYNGGDYQQWKMEDVGGGFVRIVQKATGRVLDGNGGSLYIGPWNNGDYQKWKVESTTDGHIRLVQKASGQVLDGNGKELYLGNWNGGDYQKWEAVEYVNTSRWITKLKNKNVSVSQINLPGTHDSGTAAPFDPARVSNHAKAVFAKCQYMDISEQISSGIRFLDIRLEKDGEDLRVCHGEVSYNITFDIVLQTCQDFLAENPEEFIVMSVKSEGNNFGDDFWEKKYDKHPVFYKGCNYPTVKEAAGKIVLLRRFGAGKKLNGFYIDVPDNTDNSGKKVAGSCDTIATYMVQDKYNLKASEGDFKKKVVQDFINQSGPALNNNQHLLALNFISFTGKGTFSNWLNSSMSEIPSPATAAGIMTHWLQKELDTRGKGKYGVIIMDFPPPSLINTIIATNSF